MPNPTTILPQHSAVVAGVALGSGVGAWLLADPLLDAVSAHCADPHTWRPLTIVGTRHLRADTCLANDRPHQVAAAPDSFIALLRRNVLPTASLILPTAICLGAAFPPRSLAGDPAHSPGRRFGIVYAVNTVGSVSATPLPQASSSFQALVCRRRCPSAPSSWSSLPCCSLVAAESSAVNERWRTHQCCRDARKWLWHRSGDRALLASCGSLVRAVQPAGLDLETQLKAGIAFYYDRAPATVSVKRLTGTTTLAVDGKTDAFESQ